MRVLTLNGLTKSSALALLLTGAACGGPPGQLPRAENAAPPILEVRLVLPEITDQGVRADYEDETLYLAPEPILSDSDFITVRASGGRDQAGRESVTLRVECAPEAEARMRSTSSRHVNERMAILLDGVVRSAPIVRSEVGCSGAQIGLPAAEGEAERIVERIRTQWPEG